jgi:heparosan-N-sulfate-glucuronate 5-epimerase
MGVMKSDRIGYWRRVAKVYLTKDKGYLSFWHERPAVGDFEPRGLKGYYMTFADKARYAGPRDKDGIILFDYFFDIGRQYNPLAIAQYGLGHYNLYLKSGRPENLAEARRHADWLVDHLEENERGLHVWQHHFRWHYKQYLAPGWYSAHSQGTGISLLARMYRETNDGRYREATVKAFPSLDTLIEGGGVKFVDAEGNPWLEEYLIEPPTHILNGFLWALWGVWDYHLLTGDENALRLWNDCLGTLKKNLPRYDAGFWSLYDLSKQGLRMIASSFYHSLHIVQLQATSRLTGDPVFESFARRFENYRRSWWKRSLALIYKVAFKLIYF